MNGLTSDCILCEKSMQCLWPYWNFGLSVYFAFSVQVCCVLAPRCVAPLKPGRHVTGAELPGYTGCTQATLSIIDLTWKRAGARSHPGTNSPVCFSPHLAVIKVFVSKNPEQHLTLYICSDDDPDAEKMDRSDMRAATAGKKYDSKWMGDCQVWQYTIASWCLLHDTRKM